MNTTVPDWYAVIDGTWPASSYASLGPWQLREGRGGGSRVSATTLREPGVQLSESDIANAEAGMREMGQPLLFMLRQGQDELDEMLARRGYVVKDPVVIHACPSAVLTDIPLPRVTALNVWEPLAIMREIWETGGIGPDRLAVMHRAQGPKTGFLGRQNDKPAGVAFAAIHDGVAMMHAVEILPHQRRAGMGGWFMRAAAFWALENGAETLSVICTRANTGANALYASLGMQAVGQYHYRHLPTEPDEK